MKVLLLGPNGQLGGDIRRAHEAADAPFELILLGRDQLDVAGPAVAETLAGLDFDALINCTSYHKTDEVEDNATLAFAVNTHGVAAMAETCAAKRAKFLHISTDYVFGGDSARNTPLAEDAAMAPVNVYGASKAMGETLVRLANPDALILRVASLFGVDGASGKGGNFVETMIRFGREKGELRVVEDQIMSPTATADIATAILGLLQRDAAPGRYHVVNSGGGVSWFEFARAIIEAAGVDAVVDPCPSSEYATRARRPAYSVLDNARLAATLGAPMPDWRDALGRYLTAKGHV